MHGRRKHGKHRATEEEEELGGDSAWKVFIELYTVADSAAHERYEKILEGCTGGVNVEVEIRNSRSAYTNAGCRPESVAELLVQRKVLSRLEDRVKN